MPEINTKRNQIELVIFDVNQTMFSLNELQKRFKKSGLKKDLVDS